MLTDLIKNILNNYPAGNATLREILQNSDDAGSRKQVRMAFSNTSTSVRRHAFISLLLLGASRGLRRTTGIVCQWFGSEHHPEPPLKAFNPH